ncbi:NTE family protein RssA [Rubripirellula lacrimiformis]|uniref:NTE family protein RssA n=1 Tax=Rubripirellula lacrimiformis TaxID=1930273 RepID=A0A517N9G5_9BACT|nr:patatin-like phospholipase family protein [Rubripirellula lacrimiformis]QDT03638.1 NTE family protein RssA [Rubripirellula lacrimiformis]
MIDLMRFFIPHRPTFDRDPQRRQSAAIALGGGGARGLAHLGVIEAMQQTHLTVDQIVGVSMGSLIGSMFAIDGDIQRAKAIAVELLGSPDFQHRQQVLFGAAPPAEDESLGGTLGWYSRLRKMVSAHRKLSRAVTGPSLLSDAPLRDSIEALLPDIDLADLAIPTSVVAVDLLTGHRIVLERGSLRKAVLASSAIPGIFPPVPWDGMLLCDIGTIEAVPTMVAKSYRQDLTIAVDVGQSDTRVEACSTALDVMMRVDDIGQRLMRRHYLQAADCVIRPDVGTRAWFDFSKPDEMIREGHRSALEMLSSVVQIQAA